MPRRTPLPGLGGDSGRIAVIGLSLSTDGCTIRVKWLTRDSWLMVNDSICQTHSYLKRAAMSVLLGRFSLGLSVLFVGCSPSQPSPRDAQRVWLQSIDNGSSTRLKLVSFKKTDGRPAEINGVK